MIEIYIIILLTAIIAFCIWYIKRFKYNKVHFYVTKDKNGELILWLKKPFRGIDMWLRTDCSTIIAIDEEFNSFNLNTENYNNLTFEDEPLEVYLNL